MDVPENVNTPGKFWKWCFRSNDCLHIDWPWDHHHRRRLVVRGLGNGKVDVEMVVLGVVIVVSADIVIFVWGLFEGDGREEERKEV